MSGDHQSLQNLAERAQLALRAMSSMQCFFSEPHVMHGSLPRRKFTCYVDPFTSAQIRPGATSEDLASDLILAETVILLSLHPIPATKFDAPARLAAIRELREIQCVLTH